MKRIQLVVSGKVQGVFYRNYIKQECDLLGIKGMVKNENDGTVLIIADVDKEQESKLSKLVWKGPMMAFVQDVKISDSDREETFDNFDIR